MAFTSLKHHDHRGIEPLDADPYYLVNRDNVLNGSPEPFDLHTQANANYLVVNDVEPLTTTTSPTINDVEPLTTTPSSTSSTPSPARIEEVDLEHYLPLYRAALNGDWEIARRFFECDPNALTAEISLFSMTALHVAASAGRSQFVEKLVEFMPAEALAMQDCWGNTALHYAARACGSTEAVKAMVRKNRALTQIVEDKGLTPLALAYMSGSREVLWYLLSETTNEPPSSPFTGPSAAWLISKITSAGLHDVALYLLQRYPNLATARDAENHSVLRILAERSSAFLSGSKLGFWRRRVYQFVPVELNYAPPQLQRGDMENSGELAQVPTSIQSRTHLTRVLRWFHRLLWKVIEQMGMRHFTAMGSSVANFIASALIWFSFAAPGINQVRDEKLRHKQAAELVQHVCRQVLQMNNSEICYFFEEEAILTTATSYGIVEILKECLQFFPDLIGLQDINHRNIFHVAVEHRQEKIFNLLREKTPRNRLVANCLVESENTILHLAAKLPPSPQLKSVSGSALQIQRELQWFKELENFAPLTRKGKRNADKKTAWELFTEEHKELVDRGEKWMKDTSNSCMVVATLIATVVFAAAFTVPGGNTSDKGIPIFLKNNSFMVFAISDALALFSSSTSLLMFLSILTSRYAEEDFLESLPKRLIIGLASLFFAIATMMIAFSAALSIVLGERLKGAFIPITLVACFPVTLFAMLQLPLFVQMVQSTYGSGIFHRQTNLTL